MIIYDIEIKNAVPNAGQPMVQGVEYCKGWDDHAGMGISVLCAYDTATDESRIFMDDNAEAWGAMIHGKIVAGWNNHNFDDKVSAACWGVHVGESIDLKRTAWLAAGLPTTFKRGSGQQGFGLDQVAKANFGGMGKSGSGADAPRAWQEGKIGSVIDYCMMDVILTAKIAKRMVELGFILDPRNPERVLRIEDMVTENGDAGEPSLPGFSGFGQ